MQLLNSEIFGSFVQAIAIQEESYDLTTIFFSRSKKRKNVLLSKKIILISSYSDV